jgi:Na+/proline symporter
VVGVTALYSTTGGLRAVVATDIVQLGVALLATLIYAWAAVGAVGGLAALPARLTELYGAARTGALLALVPSRAAEAGGWVIALIAVQWIAQMNADGTGYLAQRTMACRSDRDARRAAVVFVVTQVLVRSLLWMAIGLALLCLYPAAGDAAAREATFVAGVADRLPTGARGLMLVGLLAALASTVDTHLNWGASYFTNDLYRRIWCERWRRREASPRRQVWVARLGNLVVLAGALAILPLLGSIQQAWKLSLLWGAGMGVPLVLRWIWWRMTAAGELAALAVSVLAAPLVLRFIDGDGPRLFVVAGVATLAAVVAALLGGTAPAEAVVAFYRKVRPPGFWGPVARRVGEAPARARRRLGVALVATGCGALAVSLLVAAATWLFGSPAPAWFPLPRAWALTVAGLAGGAFWLARRAAGQIEDRFET